MEAPQEKKATWRSLLTFEAITLGSGALTAFLTKDSMSVYDTLRKPAFAPPGTVFPIAWIILYAGMAWSAWLVYREKKPRRKTALAAYFLQLAVNLAWPWLFFKMQALGLAFVWLMLLWALLIVTICLFARHRKMAAWLMAPYLAWTTFAGVLNFVVARMNP